MLAGVYEPSKHPWGKTACPLSADSRTWGSDRDSSLGWSHLVGLAELGCDSGTRPNVPLSRNLAWLS